MKSNASHCWKSVGALVVIALAVDSCYKEYPYWQEHLDGHYILLDRRTVLDGPEEGDVFLGGVFDLLTSPDRTAVISGKWDTRAEVFGLNLKMEPVSVLGEDGSKLRYSFGLVEGREDAYKIVGNYSVEGTVYDAKKDALVPYKAVGVFDARRDGKPRI